MAKSRKQLAFRSKHTTVRTQPSKKTQWRPKGPFRLLDLPPELRTEILELVILEFERKDILHLILTCQLLYDETASMFYREVVLDTTESRGSADPFLSGPATQLSPRRYVRNLVIRFHMTDHIHLFQHAYSRPLHDMVHLGNMQHLRLEFGSRFPSPDFWGGSYVYNDNVERRLLTGKSKNAEIIAPLYVVKAPFQSFLRFLKESEVPQLSLYIQADDHHSFWCPFHRVHPEGKACNGEWKGKASMLKVKWKRAVKALRGAQVVKTPRLPLNRRQPQSS